MPAGVPGQPYFRYGRDGASEGGCGCEEVYTFRLPGLDYQVAGDGVKPVYYVSVSGGEDVQGPGSVGFWEEEGCDPGEDGG